MAPNRLYLCPPAHTIWSAIYFGIPIWEDAARAIYRMPDSVVALLSLDANERGNFPSGLDTSLWRTYMESDELYGDQWLLSYEANIKGWLPSRTQADHVDADANFGFLKGLGVEFYDTSLVMSVPTGTTMGFGAYPLFYLPSGEKEE